MPEPWVIHLALLGVALLTTLAVTPLAKQVARRIGAIDRPGARRVNTVPIPRMGGLAVFAGLVSALLLQYLGTLLLGWPTAFAPAPHFRSMDYHLVELGFVIIFLTGVLDDVFQLKPWQKLLGQVLAAAVAVAGGLVIGTVVNPFTEGPLNLGWAAYPITIFYLVAYVNIINLIDGLDGLATGISSIAALTMLFLSVLAGRNDAAALSAALVGATLGFLRYNFNPASIFLGDSGSLLLGYALGTISLLSVTRVAGLTTIIVPLVVAAVPIIDTFSAIVRRRRAHVSISQADRGHIHHRLIDEGFNQRQAVLLIYGWTTLLCAGSLVMTQVAVVPRIAIFLALFVLSALFAQHLHLFRPVLLHRASPCDDEGDVKRQDEAGADDAEGAPTCEGRAGRDKR
ncbi:glycosyltransferase family 4 protein [Olsenella sp. HMSC062G07]|uniref:glycosyltransferase family 4 protein n=1 Tax=Olsenella sp. HMSC062G07 TaxID=1739330 RepID=UPI0008A62E4A|nr:MraY family glycosyltransferase [Olsenella sp. HMSC062G07]OFK24004.1 undecaprenyl-phosphate alpha-N-acetylglucosaminyl 1-phosphate transferase [Olsenella sp. HMSC062G07]